jgi:hypothetical protein
MSEGLSKFLRLIALENWLCDDIAIDGISWA